MTLAETTKDLIGTSCLDCFSLYAGYGMKNGQYVRFPFGVQLSEKRNEKGRVILSRYRYADDSELTYRYSAGRETFSLTAK